MATCDRPVLQLWVNNAGPTLAGQIKVWAAPEFKANVTSDVDIQEITYLMSLVEMWTCWLTLRRSRAEENHECP